MLDIETRVFSRIKNQFSSDLKTKYPNIRFTTSNQIPDVPTFPNVYVHEMKSQELGRDLQGTSINAIRSTIQIEVTDKDSRTTAREVMSEVVMIMKSMRYEVVTMPEFENGNVYRSVARFRRVIGAYDVL